MKEKKSDSFFLFRKNVTRYSFVNDKEKPEEVSNARIQRLSWTAISDGKSSPESSPNPDEAFPCLRSKSSDNLKKKAKYGHKLLKSKSSIFKTSSSSIKNMFTSGSSSGSASACSSTSSSPKVRQSWSSAVTHILERRGSGDVYDDERLNESACFLEPCFPSVNTSFSTERTPAKHFLNCTKSGFPVASLLEEDEEEEIMTTPKIICVHKKTPDVVRKTTRQIFLDLEYIKEMGMFPEELETVSTEGEEGGFDQNYTRLNGDLNFRSLRGYKTDFTLHDGKNENEYECNSLQAAKKDVLEEKPLQEDTTTLHHTLPPGTACLPNEGHTRERDSDEASDYFATFSCQASEGRGGCLNISNSSNSSSLHEYSEAEESDATYDDDESSSFEKRLEDNLEQLDEGGNAKETDSSSSVSSEEENPVQLRRKLKPNLHIDVEKAKSVPTLSNERLLQRIRINSRDSNGSAKSSPRTPRSPAIDIDDLFKQKQKRLEEASKDNLSLVKDLTQRLRLPTKPPSHVEWLNGIKNKEEARLLAEAMSPMALENSEGFFRLRETTKVPTHEQRKKNVSKALQWIRDELAKMKKQDQHLASKLMQLQLEMQRLRLLRSCTQHEALLEEVTCEEEVQRALMTSINLIDFPDKFRERAFSPLRGYGVTRMNLADRRFTLR